MSNVISSSALLRNDRNYSHTEFSYTNIPLIFSLLVFISVLQDAVPVTGKQLVQIPGSVEGDHCWALKQDV